MASLRRRLVSGTAEVNAICEREMVILEGANGEKIEKLRPCIYFSYCYNIVQ